MLVIAWEHCHLAGQDLVIPAAIFEADENVTFVLPRAVAQRKLGHSGSRLLKSLFHHQHKLSSAAECACHPHRMYRLEGKDRIDLSDKDFIEHIQSD